MSRALKTVERLLPVLAFAAVLAVILAYVSYTGLIAYMGDSFLLANRAKHLADQFNLNLNNGLVALIYPPLYPILIAFAYRFQDTHLIFRSILIVNALLAASQVFPLSLLLQQYSKISRKNAIWLAAVLVLSPRLVALHFHGYDGGPLLSPFAVASPFRKPGAGSRPPDGLLGRRRNASLVHANAGGGVSGPGRLCDRTHLLFLAGASYGFEAATKSRSNLNLELRHPVRRLEAV